MESTHTALPATSNKLQPRLLWVFLLLWVVTFLLYLPASSAGWVTDTVDWQQRVSEMNFWDYLNLTQTRVPSLYQFTQFITWLLYQFLGNNHLAWHLVIISLQAINGALVYLLIGDLAEDTRIVQGRFIALASSILFCCCPHISEVIVWMASFHYLTGLLMILVIVRLVQLYIRQPRIVHPITAAVVFALSAFSLEIFYLTPWFTLTLIIYHRSLPGIDRKNTARAVLLFFVPLILLFVGHLLLLRYVTGVFASHLGQDMLQPVLNYLRKPPAYLFHLLFEGRFFSRETRVAVYALCTQLKFLVPFYSVIGLVMVLIPLRFHKMGGRAKLLSLMFCWVAMCMVVISPVWLAETGYVAFDRYAYTMLPFLFVIVATVFSYHKIWAPGAAVLAAYTLVNVYCTLKVNRAWGKTDKVMTRLLTSFPAVGDKVVLLLNLPDNLNEIPMISAMPTSAFKQYYNVNSRKKLNNEVFDVLSHNIISPDDGAHVNVINDSTIHVTLNQWGTWWWYRFRGASSYENEYYKENLVDGGRWYELTLKKPASGFVMLYQVGGEWKKVNMGVGGVDQN